MRTQKQDTSASAAQPGPLHATQLDRSSFGGGIVVEEVAEAVPGGTRLGAEGFLVGEAAGVFDKAGDAGEEFGAFGGDAACSDGSGKSAEGAFAGLDGRRAGGERSEFAEEVVFAGGAGSEGAVGVAEAVVVGMGGEGAAAAVGEGEAAEGSFGGVLAAGGHGGSIAVVSSGFSNQISDIGNRPERMGGMSCSRRGDPNYHHSIGGTLRFRAEQIFCT